MVNVAPARGKSISDREAVEMVMRKQTSLIESRPTMKALKRAKRKKLIEEVHHLDKVLPNVEIKDITKLSDTTLTCAHIVEEKFNRAK